MARTTQLSRTREEAAKRQALANAQRTKYDDDELETVTKYDLARRQRDVAAHNLADAERDMAHELNSLFEMGNSIDRVMILVGESDKDTIKRIRRMSTSSDGNGDAKTIARQKPSTNGLEVKDINAHPIAHHNDCNDDMEDADRPGQRSAS